MKIFLLLVLVMLLPFSCGRKVTEIPPPQGFSYDFNAMVDKLFDRSIPQPGERVLLIGYPNEFEPMIPMIANKLSGAGAVYLGAISVDTASWPEYWQTDFSKSTMGKNQEELAKLFESVDLGIMLPGATPQHTPYAAMQDVLRKGMGRTIHFHWSGASDFTGKPVTIDTTVSKVYQKAVLDCEYTKLSRIQNEFEAAMRKSSVRVTTPGGTDLTFRIGDRPVTKQDGDASKARTIYARNLIDREIEIPAGAIRVPPIEESVTGIMAVPDATWGETSVQGLTLTFEKGKITKINASAGQDAVVAMLEQNEGKGKYLRELAVGFNPLLSVPGGQSWIPYYGYGAGVVRLSIGDNQELGGNVVSGWARINLFTDATVTVGEEVWVKDGQLVK